MRKGDVLFWHHWCVHASSYNGSGKVRQAVITRFHSTLPNHPLLCEYRPLVLCHPTHPNWAANNVSTLDYRLAVWRSRLIYAHTDVLQGMMAAWRQTAICGSTGATRCSPTPMRSAQLGAARRPWRLRWPRRRGKRGEARDGPQRRGPPGKDRYGLIPNFDAIIHCLSDSVFVL